MNRILWVDDQQDVAKTFSVLLSSLTPRPVYACSGTEALNLLRDQFFDVVLLDLRMPPGEWGGLWLLKEIQEANIRVPVIVLSGEGMQIQTIQAQRLGAKAYVMKEEAQSQLLPAVSCVLEKRIADVQVAFSDDLPMPVALPFWRYLNADSQMTKLRRLLEFYESILRFCCLVGLNTLPSDNSDPNMANLRLTKPSMGDLNQARKILSKALDHDSVFCRLNRAFNDREIDSVIVTRNRINHGVQPSDHSAEQILKGDKYDTQLMDFAGRLWQYWKLDIVCPSAMWYDGSRFEVTGSSIVGHSPVLPVIRFALPPPPPITGH